VGLVLSHGSPKTTVFSLAGGRMGVRDLSQRKIQCPTSAAMAEAHDMSL
jgi:hypothetical protein